MAASTGSSAKVHSALDEMAKSGAFVRSESGYRHVVAEDSKDFPPEAGRYHLYLSWACPWANRCATVRAMKGLEDAISMSVVHPTWQRTRPADPADTHCGWHFAAAGNGAKAGVVPPTGVGLIGNDGATIDHVNGAACVRDLYDLSNDTAGKYTVPILWDKKTGAIVNNESSEIIRMLNGPFARLVGTDATTPDLFPGDLAAAIEAANEWIYPNINNGVYRCGFAKTQQAYDAAVADLGGALDRLEALLAKQRYITDEVRITEADIRAFMTLVRFDEVYVVYFKTNARPIAQYPNIINYCRDLFQQEATCLRRTINMSHIKNHYFTSHPSLNCYSIVPTGPGVMKDLEAPHHRDDAAQRVWP